MTASADPGVSAAPLSRKAQVHVPAQRNSRRALGDLQVHRLYSEAMSALLFGRAGQEDAAGWAHAMRLLDVHAVMLLVPTARDPHPWVVLIQLIQGLRRTLDSGELAAAEAHLLGIGHAVLAAHGCSVVRPEYLLARPLPVVEAARRLLAR